MGNVDTDKLKQLLYAMIETLDGDTSTSSSETEAPQESPNQQSVNNVRKKKYATQENLFLSMPEKDMHKSDVEIDKKLAPKQLTLRNRVSTEIDVKCRICGKEYRVSKSLITDGVHRYKCNGCSRSSG